MSPQAYMNVSQDDNGKLQVTVVVPEYDKVVIIGTDGKHNCPRVEIDHLSKPSGEKAAAATLWEKVTES